MSPRQKACLDYLAMNTRPGGERCSGFLNIQQATGLPRADVKRSVRALARQGLAEFHKGLCDEDGNFTGSGYCVTLSGLRA